MNGEIIKVDSKVTSIEGNEFIGNLRGIDGAIIYLERTPYFDLSGNIFNSSLNIYVAGLVTSLSDFVEKATGLKGVTSLGAFSNLESDSVRMLPLLFSNLGLSLGYRVSQLTPTPFQLDNSTWAPAVLPLSSSTSLVPTLLPSNPSLSLAQPPLI